MPSDGVDAAGHPEGATLVTWGGGEMGQLGQGPDVMEKKRPGRVKQGTRFTHVVSGGIHTLAVEVRPCGEYFVFPLHPE